MPYLTPESIPVNFQCGALQIHDDVYIVAAVSGALYDLTQERNWEQFGATTPAEIAAAMQVMYEAFLASNCAEDSILVKEITITPATVFPVLLKSVAAGETVDQVEVIVDSVFDTGTLTIGDSGDNARLIDADHNRLSLAEQFEVSPEYIYSSATDVFVYLTGTPASGVARIRLYSFTEA